MFLVPGERGRGYGPDAARTLARALRGQGWTRITVDPYVWNERAIAAWKRAGFEPVERRPADDGHAADWLLMDFR
jgi:RimJ/RimL family protein N-acetyltransferase